MGAIWNSRLGGAALSRCQISRVQLPGASHFASGGHSHRPAISRRNGVLFLNPGSAGPRRFKLPVTLARLRIGGPEVEAEILRLPV